MARTNERGMTTSICLFKYAIAPVLNAGQPTALDDSATVAANGAAITINVLANDADADGDTLTISSVTQGTNGGTVSIVNGLVSYDPSGHFESLGIGETAADSFTYTISDGRTTASASVLVTITGVNDVDTALIPP